MHSRPWRRARTRSASARVLRCLVIAWRVTSAPAVRAAMERGPVVESWVRTRRRVGSPRAAKIGAVLAAAEVALRDMAFDVGCLGGPAVGVHAEGFVAAGGGDLVE